MLADTSRSPKPSLGFLDRFLANVFEMFLLIDYDTVTELLSGMKAGHVDGILMERYVAGAYYNTYKEQGLELGTMLLFPYYFGFQAPKNIPGSVSSCTILKKCVQEILKENEIVTVNIDLNLSKKSSSLNTNTIGIIANLIVQIKVAFGQQLFLNH